MTRLTFLAIAFSFFNVAASSAHAGDWVDEMKIGFWRNNCWPKPFIYPDRKAAFAPMVVMADNGWRRNNLVGAHHFTPDGGELNRSGELMVQWVLTQAPAHRRHVFVARGEDPEQTGQRIEAVQKYASFIVPEGGFNLVDTHIMPEGLSAIDVDWGILKFRENAPLPMLPKSTAGTSVTE
jgi:hypothetical protein